MYGGDGFFYKELILRLIVDFNDFREDIGKIMILQSF